jgi:DNA-binding response OmpR family regulator
MPPRVPVWVFPPADTEETNMTQNILVVEDEVDLALGIRDALTHAGFRTDVVHDGKVALEYLRKGSYDLVVLDLMLPGMNGLDLLRELRKDRQDTRVLILTALSSEEDLLAGFQAGADDYLAKPCSPRELVARVEAQFRRRAIDSQPPARMELPGGISVDLARLEVHRDGNIIPLTPREGDILDYLVRHRDRVVTRDDLLLDVWHYKSANVETRTVDIHIVGLRRKVEPDPAKPTLIQTVRGKGYRWFN